MKYEKCIVDVSYFVVCFAETLVKYPQNAKYDKCNNSRSNGASAALEFHNIMFAVHNFLTETATENYILLIFFFYSLLGIQFVVKSTIVNTFSHFCNAKSLFSARTLRTFCRKIAPLLQKLPSMKGRFYFNSRPYDVGVADFSSRPKFGSGGGGGNGPLLKKKEKLKETKI